MRTRGEHVRKLGVGDECAHRNAVSKGLRRREEIRLDGIVLPAPPLAGATHAALDLIADHDEILLVAERADARHELLCRRVHAAFALDSLDHDGNGLVGHRRLDGIDVIEVRIVEADGKRLEAILAPRLPGGGDCGQGTTMERIAHRDDLVASAVRGAPLAGELDRGLVRLSA